MSADMPGVRPLKTEAPPHGALAGERDVDLGEERRAIAIAAFGWGLDAMDISIFSLLAPSLMATFAVGRGEIGILATSSLLSSAVGGWIVGVLSDRMGRLPALRLTVAWFSAATVFCGLAGSYGALLALRLFQGLGFGGEMTVGAVLVSEIVRSRFRGRALGLVQSTYAIGWAAALAAFFVVTHLVPGPATWRYLFIFCGLAGLPLFVARCLVRLPRYSASEGVPAPAGPASEVSRLRARDIFAPAYLGRTILASALCLGVQGGAYSLAVWLPTFLQQEKGFSNANTSGFLSVFVAGTFCGYLLAGYLNDRIGRRRMITLFSAASVATVLLDLYLPVPNWVLLAALFPLGLFSFGIYSGLGPIATELYPKGLRGAGQGFCFNFGRGLGSLFPTIIGFLSQEFALSASIAVLSGVCYCIAFVASLLLADTSGIELDEVR